MYVCSSSRFRVHVIKGFVDVPIDYDQSVLY